MRAPAVHVRDAVVAALVRAGGAGVVEHGDDLVTYLPAGAPRDAVAAALEAAGGTTVEWTDAGAIDVAARWPARVGVQRLGAVAVAPPWLAHEIADAAVPVVIEPAMAFGTGEHETTRGVLRLLPRVVRSGDVVADLGAGSGVLSIAAAGLGAARVAAVELDPDAIGNLEENVARNGVGHRVHVIPGDARLLLPLLAPVRVIVANIVSSVLLDLSPLMRAALAPDGRAVLSGLLVAERDAVRDALERDGWTLEELDEEGSWWSVVTAAR